MIRYTLQPPEAGTYAEIYLPKNPNYQGPLFDALTQGFDLKIVTQYLQDNQSEIKIFMQPAIEFYDTDVINDLPDYFSDLYGGYSMYEVDGVFRPKEGGLAPLQERTQVIRIMFTLDIGKVMKESIPKEKLEYAELLARAYLRSHHWKKELFLRDYLALGSGELDDNELNNVLRSVERWARLVGMFLFGYVVKRIAEIAKEEEIWVAFFWNLIVARVVSDG